VRNAKVSCAMFTMVLFFSAAWAMERERACVVDFASERRDRPHGSSAPPSPPSPSIWLLRKLTGNLVLGDEDSGDRGPRVDEEQYVDLEAGEVQAGGTPGSFSRELATKESPPKAPSPRAPAQLRRLGESP